MDQTPHADLRVATADGPGCGRFLVRALVDALDAGSDLASVSLQPASGSGGAWAIELTFAGSARHGHEVIRVGLDPAGRLVSAELLRSPRQVSERRYRWPADLAAALRAGEEVLALRLESGPAAGEPRAIVLSLGAGPDYTLDLGAFGPAPEVV